MSLKKYLKTLNKNNSGQVFMEYVILLVVIGTLTIVATSNFFKGFFNKTDEFQTRAMTQMGPSGVMSNLPEAPEPAAIASTTTTAPVARVYY
jgi:hypothetical protein